MSRSPEGALEEDVLDVQSGLLRRRGPETAIYVSLL
jgi:hypothetical protein